jgi:hypothetical protein
MTTTAPTAANVHDTRSAVAYIQARIDAYLVESAAHVDDAEACELRARRIRESGRPSGMLPELDEAVTRHMSAARRLLAAADDLRARLDACRV